MNKDMLEYLNINSEKIIRLEKDEKVVKHNLTNNMHTWIKGYTDEMEYANEERKRTLKREIENISQDIIDTEERVAKEYDSKKKVVLSDSVRKIEEFMGDLFDDVVRKINEGKNNLDGLKQEINKNSMSGNFDDVIILAAQAKKSETALSELNSLKDNVTSIINRITKILTNMDNISFADAKTEYDSYIKDISNLSTDFDFDFDFEPKPEKENIEEILYYLEKAQDSNGDISKRKEALDYAYNLVKKLEDEELKETLLADLAIAYDSIKKDSEPIVDPNYEHAAMLVEKAEKTEKSVDFIKALDSLEKVEESKRNELAARLNEVRKKAETRFEVLIEEIKREIVENNTIDNKKFLELEDKYKYISKDLAEKYKDDFSNIIIFNNNLKQEEVKENYKKKKEGFFAKLGKIVTFVKGSKIASKINVKKLLKLKASAQDVEDEEELQEIEKKANKVSNKLTAGSVVGGLRLFVAQESLENMKAKLYSGAELSSRKIKIYNKAVKTIDKQMNKGLDAKCNLAIEAQDKKYVTSVIDQYLYLIATGDDYDSSIQKLNEYLEKVSDRLTDAESSAINEEALIIKDYRDATDGDIYEIKSNIEDDVVTTELDDIVKYYDSEEYNKGFRNTPVYIKR